MTVPYYLVDSYGRVIATGVCRQEHVPLQARDGCTAHVGEASEMQYRHFETGELLARGQWVPPNDFEIQADGLPHGSITGIPVGSRCWLSGPVSVHWIQTAAEPVQITTVVAGDYVLNIDPPHHVPKQVRVRAVL